MRIEPAPAVPKRRAPLNAPIPAVPGAAGRAAAPPVALLRPVRSPSAATSSQHLSAAPSLAAAAATAPAATGPRGSAARSAAAAPEPPGDVSVVPLLAALTYALSHDPAVLEPATSSAALVVQHLHTAVVQHPEATKAFVNLLLTIGSSPAFAGNLLGPSASAADQRVPGRTATAALPAAELQRAQRQPAHSPAREAGSGSRSQQRQTASASPSGQQRSVSGATRGDRVDRPSLSEAATAASGAAAAPRSAPLVLREKRPLRDIAEKTPPLADDTSVFLAQRLDGWRPATPRAVDLHRAAAEAQAAATAAAAAVAETARRRADAEGGKNAKP